MSLIDLPNLSLQIGDNNAPTAPNANAEANNDQQFGGSLFGPGGGNQQMMLQILMQILKMLEDMLNGQEDGQPEDGSGSGAPGAGSGAPGAGNGTGEGGPGGVGEDGGPDGVGDEEGSEVEDDHHCCCHHDEDETSWEVNQDDKTIKLDNGYELSFSDQSQEWTLTDAEGNKTRVWGDPHVDEDGDGQTDWDFKKDSTFILEDGTKITVGTKDIGRGDGMTVSDTLTITKGDQAIEVTGIADNNVQIGDVTTNGRELDADTNDGYIFTEGDDGVANWYDNNGQEIDQDQAMGNERIWEEVIEYD